MRRDKDIRQIALQVSIALSASVFSIMPSVSAAPVVDHVVSGGAVIDQTSPQVTDITSTTKNNVIDWKDFSVSQGETVRFDEGKHTNNYLNVVTGPNTSQIDGVIQGGANVYIVNPNGVVFGESASVDVGALYVSTRNIDDTVKDKFGNGDGIDLRPLKDTAALPSSDIVNMGTVQANSVFLEGGNIVIGEVNKIKTADGSAVNNNVTIQTNGDITLGRSVSSIVAEQKANDTSKDIMVLANTSEGSKGNSSGYTYTLNSTTNLLPQIYNEDDLLAVSSDCVGKSATYTYYLKNDLDFSKSGAPAFSPISNFSSTFDGEYHTISGIKVTSGTYGGLFGLTSGATIKNVGVENVNITAGYAGGIAGKAVNTTFTNVYAGSGTITTTGTANEDEGVYYAGGLVGHGTGVTITESYNWAKVTGEGGGLIGTTNGATTITDSYSAGALGNSVSGIMALVSGGTPVLTRVYTTGTSYTGDTSYNTGTNSFYGVSESGNWLYSSTYSSWGDEISNKGGETSKAWRIYEGQSLPLLRAFLKGKGIVTVDYKYTHGDDATDKDKPDGDLSVTYNGSNITLSGITYTKDGEVLSEEDQIKIITAPANNTLDGNVIGLDSSGNVRTKAAFYTGQQGYDLVDNNYTIEQRTINVNTALGSANFDKEYDGEYKLTEADIKNIFASTGGNTGIVDADKDTVKLGFEGTLNSASGPVAVYKDSAGNIDNTNGDADDVGLTKKVYISGDLKLTGNDKNNYKIVASTSTTDGITVSGNKISIAKEYDGVIYHKILKVGFNEQALNREYDGTSVAKETVESSDFSLKNSDGSDFTGSDVSLEIDSNIGTAYFLDGNGSSETDAATYVGTHNVVFNGITLSGDAKNYVLLDVNNPDNVVYASTTGYIHKVGDEYVNTGVPDSNGTWTTQGEITPRTLTNYGFYWYDDVNDTTESIASRQYNGGASFEYVDADYTDPIAGKIVKNNATPNVKGLVTKDTGKLIFEVQSAEFITSETDVTADSATDVQGTNGAQGVRYKVKVKGATGVSNTDLADILQNYQFGDSVLNTTSEYSVAGIGEITPRTIKIGALNPAEKQYDADTVVKVNGKNEFTLSYTEDDGLLGYTGGDQYKLLNDGTKITYGGVYQNTAEEGAANVNLDNAGQVADKNITYTATLDDGGTGNYILEADGDHIKYVDANDKTQVTIDNGLGKITQREISALYFTEPTKEYDTTATVNQNTIAIDVGAGTNQVKLYGADNDDPTKVFDYSKVSGVYVHIDENRADSDVENGGAAKSKQVTYTLQEGFIKSPNYKLTNPVTTVNGYGAITQANLNDRSKLTLDVSGVTKVYDGDADIKGNFIGSGKLVYNLNGNSLTLDPTVHAAYYDSADTDGSPQGITYELTVTGDSTGNYTIGSALLTDGYLKWSQTVDGWTSAEKAKMTGVITKKDLVVSPLNEVVTKVYDGGLDVKKNGAVLKNDGDVNTAVTFDGWIDVDGRTKSATASYINKNVDSTAETEAGGKTVNYVITLDSISQGNYTLKDAAGNELTNNTLTGIGHITPATLTVTFTPNPVTKTYDGEKSFTGEVTPVYDGIVTNDKVGLKKFTTTAGDRYYSVAEFDTADKGTDKDVYYTVELEGTDKDNYVLANSETVDNVTTMTGKGTISPKELSDSDIKISFADIISKVYDATDNVSFDHTGDGRYFDSELGNTISATAESYVNNLTVGGVTLTMGDNGDYKVYSAHYNSAGVGANKATYVFTLQGNKLDNFDMTHLSSTLYDQTNKRLTLATDSATNTINTTSVSITRKLLQASLNETVLDLDRTYNGTASLPVSAADAASKVTVTGFVNDNGDTTAFDGNLVNGRYVDRNVAYDADGNITTKDVLFDVKLTGNGKENYVINDTNANSTTLTGENLGKITPAPLTVEFGYTEKTYNNNADAPLPADTEIKLTGLQTDDTALTLNTAAIVAQFGSKDGDTFTANGDVNYIEGADDPVGYKGVQYSNLQNAMEIGFGEDDTGYKIAKNYTIADTVYFNEAAQKGKIKRLALTQEYIKTRWDTVTKEYDGTDAAPEGKLHIYTDVLGTTSDKWVDLNYVLEDNNGAVYDNQQVNVVSGHGVTYTLNSLEAKEFHNFEMTPELMDSFNGKTYTTTGNITPRVLSISIKDADNWVKVYDGGTSLKDANGAVQNQFEYDFVEGQDILQQDSNSVNLIVTGAYGDATANIEPESTATTGKTIKYTLTLDGNTAGNYTLDPDGAAVKNVDETTYTGTGAIKKRTVYVAFDDDYDSTEINRAYKGANDTSAPVDKTRINLVTTIDGDTGLLDADAAVELKKEDIEANYESANVARNTNTKEVEKQNVYVTNFNLQGTGSGNYAVRVNDANNPKTLVGQGTINPIAVMVALDNAPEKTYDKTKAIKDTYLTNDNFTFTPATHIASENVVNDIAITGEYKDANAGTAAANYADKEYSYSLTLNNGNYELVTGDDNGHTVTASDYGMKAVLTGRDGTITPRKVSVNSIADMTKVYDGTLDGTTNAAANISLNNAVNGMDTGLISGDDAELSATAVYTDNPHSGVSADSDELQEHVVKYTLSLSNPNYELTDDSKEVTGTGYITRRTLSLVADSVSVDVGGTMPEFNGKVTGFAKDEQDNYTDFINGVSFKVADGTTTSTPGSYGVYGWYMGNKTGLLGLDYTFEQAPANATAFTVNYVNDNNGNPDTKITPNNDIYNQISKDMSSGFGDNGAAAIEYQDKSGNVLATETIDSGEIHGTGLEIDSSTTDMSKQAEKMANIGIAGGDIVNMEGANAASNANISVSGDGTTVNLEVYSINGEEQSEANTSVAEITNTDSRTGTASIENADNAEAANVVEKADTVNGGLAQIELKDEKQDVLSEDVKDKSEEEEKEGEIAIKSSNGEDDDEIELTVEKEGVNVA